ncbi:MAG TPA: hypothetical protein VLL48_01795, partial [Longimicrobiales bacterium]|nr:hypothetical protein [Longimicrobiales bacterium]
LLVAALLTWTLPWAWTGRLILFLAALALLGTALQLRGVVVGRAIGKALYAPRGAPAGLREIGPVVDHVICATDLHAGEHVYFSGRFVYAYRFGWGTPGGLPLHAAVQASAAFPGAFPPRWMRTDWFDFAGGRERPGPLPRLMALADGGVYDNMADQWPSRIGERGEDPHAPELTPPDELVVVNASAGLGWRPTRHLRVPLVGEVLALVRDVGVLYDNSATLRRQALVDRFRTPDGLDGALVHIEQSPFHVPRAFEPYESPVGERARAALAKLEDEREWEGIAEANAAAPTTLGAVGTETAARLLRHGYVLAMANLHVILGYPLREAPERSAFESLAS